MALYSEKLGALVTKRVRERGIATRDIARKSEGKISHQTVNEIMRGQVFSPDKIVTLAILIGDDPDEYLAAAGKPYKYTGPRDLSRVMSSLVAA